MGKTQSGFALVEVAVAILMLGIATVALFSAILCGLLLVDSSRARTQAMADARTVFEEMRRLADANLPQVTNRDWVVWAADANGGNLTNPQFRTNPPPLTNEAVTVAFVNPAADPLQTTVTIGWLQKNRARTAVFTALVTRR